MRSKSASDVCTSSPTPSSDPIGEEQPRLQRGERDEHRDRERVRAARQQEAADPVDGCGHDREARLDRGHHPTAGHALANLEVGELERVVLEAVGELVAAAHRLAEQDPRDRERLLHDARDVRERLLRRLRDPPALVADASCQEARRAGSARTRTARAASSSKIMPIIVATTVVTFDAIEVAVFVTTFWTPPMSFEMRDCTSPVRVRVKNASESRWRWRKTAARRSCITRWPTWFESSVWITPSAPVDDRDHDDPRGVERELARCRSRRSPRGRA